MNKEENCPFCNNIEPKSRILAETDHSIIILSNPALVKAHILVIPKKHVEKISELTRTELDDLINQVLKFQKIILKKFKGCDIRQNYRPFQKQNDLKVDHLHIHLQPRELFDELYEKCQIKERDIFRKLNQEELDEIKEFVLE